jgi:hypothetical protein
MSELDTSGSVEGLGRATSPVYSTTTTHYSLSLFMEGLLTDFLYESLRMWLHIAV